MLFRRPSVRDKPITLFRLENGIALHFVQSEFSTYTRLATSYNSEKLVVPLKGSAEVLGLHAEEKDFIYIPRGIDDIEVQLERKSVVYVVEAPSDIDYTPYVKRFEEARYVDIGDMFSRRRRYIMIGLEDVSSRFLAGYTMCCPGCWGSYPPHRHDDKYEIFIYFDVEPGFGIQLLIDDDREEAYVVRDLDVFLATRGYHPNVSAPIRGLNYLWVMIAVKGVRDFSMKIREDFQKSYNNRLLV